MAQAPLSALVLDDNAHMRGLMRAILSGFNVRQIEEAADAADALQMLRTSTVDMAFVDFRLSGLDGVEFCKLVRTASDTPNPFLPIIMITAYSERSRVLEAVNAGVDEFLVKPVRAIDVAARLNAVIERRRPFVRSSDYFGPDRRRRDDPRYRGPLRRSTDPGALDI
jgi:two-component system, chemotaxis family, chemotaxis protein CheY